MKLSFQNTNRRGSLGATLPITIQVPDNDETFAAEEGRVNVGTQVGTYVMGPRSKEKTRFCYIRGVSIPRENPASQGRIFQGTTTETAVTAPKFANNNAGIALIGGTAAGGEKMHYHLRGFQSQVVGGEYTISGELGNWTQKEAGLGRHVWQSDQFIDIQRAEAPGLWFKLTKLGRDRFAKDRVTTYKMHLKVFMEFYPNSKFVRFSGWYAFDDLVGPRWSIPNLPQLELSVPDTWGIHVQNHEARGGVSESNAVRGGRHYKVIGKEHGRVATGYGYGFRGTLLASGASDAESEEFELVQDDLGLHAMVDPDEMLGHMEGRFDFRPRLRPNWTSHQAYRADRYRYIRRVIDRYTSLTDTNPFTATGFLGGVDATGSGDAPCFQNNALGDVFGPDGGFPACADIAVWSCYDLMCRGTWHTWADTDPTPALRYKKVARGDRPNLMFFEEKIHNLSTLTTPRFDYGKEYQTVDKYRYAIPSNPFVAPPNTPAYYGEGSRGRGRVTVKPTNPAHQYTTMEAIAWTLTSDWLYQETMEQNTHAYMLERNIGLTGGQVSLQEWRSLRYIGRVLLYEHNLVDRTLAATLKAHIAERISPTTLAFKGFWDQVNDNNKEYAWVALPNQCGRRFQEYRNGNVEVWFVKIIAPVAWRLATVLDTTEAWTWAYEMVKGAGQRSLFIENGRVRRISYLSVPGYSRSCLEPSMIAPGSQGELPPLSWLTDRRFHHTDSRFGEMEAGGMQACYMIALHQGDVALAQVFATLWQALTTTETPNNQRYLFYTNRWQSYQFGAAGLIDRYDGSSGGGGSGGIGVGTGGAGSVGVGEDPVNFTATAAVTTSVTSDVVLNAGNSGVTFVVDTIPIAEAVAGSAIFDAATVGRRSRSRSGSVAAAFVSSFFRR